MADLSPHRRLVIKDRTVRNLYATDAAIFLTAS